MPQGAVRPSTRQSRILLSLVGAIVGLALHLRHGAQDSAEAFVSVGSASEGSRLDRRSFLAPALLGVSALFSSSPADAQILATQSPLYRPRQEKGAKLTPREKQDVLNSQFGKDLGAITDIQGYCFETTNEGKVATPVAGVIVYDKEAPCGKGKAFIHAAGEGQFAPMTAGGGPTRHTYSAVAFDDDDLIVKYKELIGQCADIPRKGQDKITWEIANTERGGSCV